MNIGIVCYASVGGSGIVATELAKMLAGRGHEVHLVSSETPFRLNEYQAGLAFHRVTTPAYPLFREPQYLLSLTNRIVQLSREFNLDIVHAHYAVPHATAAFLAKQILMSGPPSRVPKIITTLHGTDITLLGNDTSYSETVAFSIDASDGVTAVSESLKADTYNALRVRNDIRVIPNFLDCAQHHRVPVPDALRQRICRGRCEKIVIHVSNFRPVKRADAVVRIFDRIRKQVDARLLLVGEGPELARTLRIARELGIADQVESLGEQDQVQALLSVADVMLLPSEQESFGLSALEAMACETPVVASRVGGLPEVITDGVNGFLHPPDDLDGMAASAVRVMKDDALHARITRTGRQTVETEFCADLIVPKYEEYYDEVLATRKVRANGSGS
ncbi:MAG: N-acetyl-alpha-D-glucosaminyl L-malate synthase BshA [Acidobacteriota bacterium]|nr:N-acetyl-alpha-D-glucosaminyl L-malate synthase BshA [Acidobacteriota bacterium]